MVENIKSAKFPFKNFTEINKPENTINLKI